MLAFELEFFQDLLFVVKEFVKAHFLVLVEHFAVHYYLFEVFGQKNLQNPNHATD